MSLQLRPYDARRAVLTTMHGNETGTAPAVFRTLGLVVTPAPNLIAICSARSTDVNRDRKKI